MSAGKVGERGQGQVGVSQAAGPWGVQTKVQLQVNELGEATRADAALERPGARVQAQMCLQVAGAAEALVTHRALVGPLPSMHQVVLLQVGELGEALLAQGALERALPAVHSQMDLEVGELPKALTAHVALIQDFAVLFLQRVRQCRRASLGAQRGPLSCSHPSSLLRPCGVGPGSGKAQILALGGLGLAGVLTGPWVGAQGLPPGAGVLGLIDINQQAGHSHGGVGGVLGQLEAGGTWH